MELNMPIKAVKQKPIANMDFMRTCKDVANVKSHDVTVAKTC